MDQEPLPAETPNPADAEPKAAPSFAQEFWGGFLRGLFPNLAQALESKEPKAAPAPTQPAAVTVSPLPLPVRVELPTPAAGPAGSTSFGTFTGGVMPPPLPLVQPAEEDATPGPAPSIDVSPFTPRELPAFAIPDVTPDYSPRMDGDQDVPTFARGAGLLEQLGNREIRDAIEKLTDALEATTDQLKKQPQQPQQPGHQPGGGFVPLGMPPASAGAGTPRPIVPTRGMPPASSGLPSPWERVVRGR